MKNKFGGNTSETIRQSRVLLWRGHCSVHQMFLPQHVAGFREDYWEAATEMFADNLARFVAGLPLANVVEKQLGY